MGKGKEKNNRIRYNIITILVYLIGIVLLAQLFNLQIIHGAEYRETSNVRLTRESVLKADRGNIKDNTGTLLARVEAQNTIVLYKTKVNNQVLNDTILRLINLLSKNGDKYVDNFLMEVNPYRFKLTEEESQRKWKKVNNINEDATAEETFNYFKNKYEITTDNVENARKIMAIRYEISYQGYSNTKSIQIAQNISRNTLLEIKERNSDFPGVEITEEPKRVYPLGNTASHIIGRIGRIEEEELKGNEDTYDQNDIIGKSGIEYVFEEFLKGKNGVKQIDMDVEGTITNEYIAKEAVAGNDVILTIDSKLQATAEQAIKNNIERIANGAFGKASPADAGVAVVLNVKTGEVLAMASNPDYDPSAFVNGIDENTWNYYINGDTKPLENKAISAMYSPGSTYKMVTALAGLETGAITTTDKIRDTGIYRKYNSSWKCWKISGHGYLDVSNAIERSCNYFFYELGDRVGIDTLAKYSYYLGLGHKTGIELKGEIPGVLASNEIAKQENRVWNPGETISAAIGQSYNTFTPIQMAKYVAMVANRGKKLDVTIVKSIIRPDGSEIPRNEYESKVSEKLGLTPDNTEEMSFNETNIQAILEGMRGVTSESGGTAYSTFRDFDIEVGGKTGSAQTGVEGKTNAWFVGFAPFDNPEIAIVVFVRNGGSGGYTAEVARDIIAQYFGMNTSQVYEDMQAIPTIQIIN
ncbi:penicillin-binding protein 2 [Clostridium sp. CAG:780]|nr:penicillin-binding protein 2 [Clostridium sp. CAG:780]